MKRLEKKSFTVFSGSSPPPSNPKTFLYKDVPIKQCTKCKETKYFSEFHKKKERLDSQCRQCISLKRKKKRDKKRKFKKTYNVSRFDLLGDLTDEKTILIAKTIAQLRTAEHRGKTSSDPLQDSSADPP